MSRLADIQTDTALERCAVQLQGKLQRAVAAGLPWNQDTLKRVQRLVQRHRMQVRETQGLEMPELVPLIFHSIRYIHLVRRDLEPKSIEITIINLMQRFPMIPMLEMVQAIDAVFPDYVKRTRMIARDVAAINDQERRALH